MNGVMHTYTLLGDSSGMGCSIAKTQVEKDHWLGVKYMKREWLDSIRFHLDKLD